MAQADQKSESEDNRLQVTVCGGGNGAHAFVVTAAAKFSPRFRVNWLSLYGDEAERINKQLAQNDGYIQGVFVQENALVSGKPNIVTNDPSKVIPGSDIIILCVPAFAHTQYLEAINKYHEICSNDKNISSNGKKLIIAAFPSACGLEFAFVKLINNYENVVLFNCLTLPWACRFIEYGKNVEILGIKVSIGNYVFGTKALINKLNPLAKLQSLFLDNKPILNCDSKIHILSSSLGSMNPVIHNAIMYNQWNDYDGKKEFIDKPLFYQGIDQKGADLMTELSNEVISIGNKFNSLGLENKILFPKIYDWYVESYAKDCTKTDTLYGLITTNPGYNGLTHPMKPGIKDNKKWIPNWGYRYLTEDIPFGLLVTKAMSCMLDDYENNGNKGTSVNTPVLDKILLWAEKQMNKNYFIIDDKTKKIKINLDSKDIQSTRVPQRFGLNTVDDILKM